uniref:Variant surface glycoprotein 1125.5226 n=1 Tax=Trypanosoma brucei TaxID=5691 RepID=A0A1J0RC77_9TRYP|nr:variant surface glycoprotein 1125.5226 [Trypanosoma brucei]
MLFRDATVTKPNENLAAADISHNLWEKQWQGWLEAERQLRQNKDDTDVKSAGIHDLTDSERRAAAAIIAPIAAEAFAVVNSIRPDVPEPAALAGNKPSERLAQAVFGETKLNSDQPDVAKVLTATLGDNGVNVYSNDHANKLKALLGTAICLCHKDNAGATEGACGSTIAGEVAWTDGSILPTQPDVTKLMKSCGTVAKTTVTWDELAARLSAVTELIKVKNKDGYLGSFIDDCSGNGANGMCVKFTVYTAAPRAVLSKVPWLESIRTLAEDIKIRIEHNEDDEKTINQLETLIYRIEATLHQIELYAATIQSGTAPLRTTQTLLQKINNKNATNTMKAKKPALRLN